MNDLDRRRSANPENNVCSPVNCLIPTSELNAILRENDGKSGIQYRLVGIMDMESNPITIGSSPVHPVVTTHVKPQHTLFGVIDGTGNPYAGSTEYSIVAVLTYGPVTVLSSCILTHKEEKVCTQMPLYATVNPKTSRWALATGTYMKQNNLVVQAPRLVPDVDFETAVKKIVSATRSMTTVCATVEKHMDDGDYVTVLLQIEM